MELPKIAYYKCRRSLNIENFRNDRSMDYLQKNLVYLLRPTETQIYIFEADYLKILSKKTPRLLNLSIPTDKFEKYFYRDPFKIETHLNELANNHKRNKQRKAKRNQKLNN